MVLTLDPAPNAPSYSNPDTFEPDTSNYLAWMKVIRDQLSGQVLQPGDGGILGIAPLIGNAGVTDNSIPPGFYRYVSVSGSSGGPAGTIAGHLYHARRNTGGGEAQLIIIEDGGSSLTSGRIYSRSRIAGAWTPWLAGAIESDFVFGSGPNGEFFRLPNGLQVCTHTGLSVTDIATVEGQIYKSSPEITWNFPASFLSAAGLTVSASPRTASVAWGNARATSGTAASVRLMSGLSLTGNIIVELRAVGRWK